MCIRDRVYALHPALRAAPPPGERGAVSSKAGEAVRRGDQRPAVRRFEGAVAGVGGHDEIGFGPRAVERPGTEDGADDVVAALDDDSGDCLLYTSPSPRDRTRYRMPSSA